MKLLFLSLTGFLNARRSREFMSDLWNLLAEAQENPDGIPSAIVEKKMKELKEAAAAATAANEGMAKISDSDWAHRYTSLTGGRYGKPYPSYPSEIGSRRRSRYIIYWYSEFCFTIFNFFLNANFANLLSYFFE